MSIFLFLVALPISFVYRKYRKNIWLLCEYGEEARDNAFFLFKYLRNEHREIDSIYALNKDSVDMEKVRSLGEVVHYGSLKHWIYYLSAEANISTQKGGKPNAAVCYFLEVVSGLLKNTRIFLQHGIINNDLPYLHYEKSKLRLFITSTKKEFDFICSNFKYPKENVVLTGLCRYDNLVDRSDGTVIGIVPTWREWLYRTDEMKRIEGEAGISSNLSSTQCGQQRLQTYWRDTAVKILRSCFVYTEICNNTMIHSKKSAIDSL